MFSAARTTTALAIVLVFVGAAGCAKYVTPGGGVQMSKLADADIKELMERTPAASFPARLVTVRIQTPGYRSHTNESYGSGRYSVVTTRDIEREAHFERLGRLPMVAAVGPLNRLVLPSMLESFKELRVAAAPLRADMLLVYTLDTSFHIQGKSIAPLTAITLGLLPLHEATVTTTASAAIYDVRTGFIYGLAEATQRQNQPTSLWTSRSVVDDTRLRTEARAFDKLVGEIERVWSGIVAEHAPRTAGQPGP